MRKRESERWTLEDREIWMLRGILRDSNFHEPLLAFSVIQDTRDAELMLLARCKPVCWLGDVRMRECANDVALVRYEKLTK